MEQENENSISLIKITFIMVVLIAAIYYLSLDRPSILPADTTQTLDEVLEEPVKSFPEDSNMLIKLEDQAAEILPPEPRQAPIKKLTEDEILDIFTNSKLQTDETTPPEPAETESSESRIMDIIDTAQPTNEETETILTDPKPTAD